MGGKGVGSRGTRSKELELGTVACSGQKEILPVFGARP